jgi:geranylgeranyl reductase family protein
MKDFSDVIVVGGGPCGSFTALKLARLGATVSVFEEHSEVGVPSHCPGHLSIKGLKDLGLHPLPKETIEDNFSGATFYSPKGNEFSIRFSSPVTCVVNRVLFDKYIAERAKDAGANYQLDSRVESLIIEGSAIKGVAVKQKGKTEKKLAEIVVDAEGISSRMIREAGLATLNRHKLVNGLEAEVENVQDTESDMVEVFLGRNYAPGFYAWLIPKKDGKAKVGLAANTGHPKELLQRLMSKHPVASKRLRNTRILRIALHPITLGGPIDKAYANRFLAVGDAASQVKPTTGGGVVFGMTCARIAAEIADEALRKNDFSSKSLGAYQKLCEQALGFDLKVMLRMRKTLDAMSDSKIDDLIGLCARLGLDKILKNVRDVDFQGQTLLRVLRSPRMLAALGYFFFAYLSANV